MHDVNPDNPVRHYLSTDKDPVWNMPSELTALATLTRRLLCDALDKRFFSRYYDLSAMEKTSYTLEMQLKLHPIWKKPKRNINAVVVLVFRQHGYTSQQSFDKLTKVNEKIRDQLRSVLSTVAEPIGLYDPEPSSTVSSSYFDPVVERDLPKSG
ncbi:hypothetical protein V7S43_000908 [Phytophthora oleae]|uniref:Uncharacterized protein n=1 Tax=Phytophthora oleae TaxID=2107226 RepID=A0ABD3G737_9STRA